MGDTLGRSGLLFALAALVAATGAGCSIEDTPHAPTFTTDVKPIMLSRCVRCHGAGGHLHADPHSTNPAYRIAPFDGFFDRMEDDCPDAQPTACHGLRYYVTTRLTQFNNFIHRMDPNAPMPPLPAPALTTHQLDVIDLWIANGAPE
jgi:hypothetical protein